MDNLVESRCLDIGEDALSEADNCDSKCSWMQINSDENAAAELLEEHGLLPPISHRYNWRPVFREWDDGKLYVRMRPVFMEKGRLRSANLTVLMKKGLVLTIAESDGVNAILKKIEKELRGSAKLRKKGCEGLFMMLVRIIVDSSYEYLESLGVKIDRTEMEITTNPGENVLTKLHNMRRDLMAIRRQIWSLRSFSDAMGRSEQMSKEAVEEAMEMHEESLHLMEISESYREMLSSLTDIYVSSLSYRTNEIMKVLTIIATIFIPLTFITGLYGMNFRPEAGPYSMPELDWYWGYPATLLGMTIIAIVMVLYFKRKRWI